MESNIASSILKVCVVLNKHEVQYLVVGGIAVALHGYFRHSIDIAGNAAAKPDFDFWYNPTYENYFRLLNALEELGQDVTEFKNEQAPNPTKSFFKFELDNLTLDLLPKLKALLSFRSSYDTREVVNLKGTDIPFISYNDLIKDKEVNPRPKDIIDIEQLKNRKLKE